MALKVINKTDWNTNDLRKLAVAALKQVVPRTAWQYDRMEIWVVKYSGYCYNTCGVGGRARYNGNYVKILVPAAFAPIDLAWTLAHELLHTIGVKHGQMDTLYRYPSDERTLLSNDLMHWALPYLDIRRKQVKEKPKQDIKVVRFEHAKKMLEEKERKIKRLQGQRRKWADKVKYYERTLAAVKKGAD